MTPDYTSVRAVHVSAAALSIALFVARGALLVRTPHRLRSAWLRIGPHVVDTVLLVSALTLAWQIGFAANKSWLGAKITALVAYIVLGTIALKRGRTVRMRVAAFVAAVLTFAYIVSVAITKSPLGFLGL